MALVTSKEYLDSVKKLKPKVYVGGKWVKNLLENPVTKSMVMANAAIYDLAQQPECKEIMVATSHLTGEPINRNLNVARNIHDLDMRQEMALLTSQTVGTCNYRCVGCDALNALAATTWEMDRDLGTNTMNASITGSRWPSPRISQSPAPSPTPKATARSGPPSRRTAMSSSTSSRSATTESW